MIIDKVFPVDVSAATGNSPAYTATGRLQTILPYGNFGGGTLTMKASLDGGSTWTVLETSITWTTAVFKSFTLAKGTLFRLELAGATTPSLNARLVQDDNN